MVTPPSERMSRSRPRAITTGATATTRPLTNAALALGTSPLTTTTTIDASTRRIALTTIARTRAFSARAAHTDMDRIAAPSTMVATCDQSAVGAATRKATETSTSRSTSAKPCGRDVSLTPSLSGCVCTPLRLPARPLVRDGQRNEAASA